MLRFKFPCKFFVAGSAGAQNFRVTFARLRLNGRHLVGKPFFGCGALALCVRNGLGVFCGVGADFRQVLLRPDFGALAFDERRFYVEPPAVCLHLFKSRPRGVLRCGVSRRGGLGKLHFKPVLPAELGRLFRCVICGGKLHCLLKLLFAELQNFPPCLRKAVCLCHAFAVGYAASRQGFLQVCHLPRCGGEPFARLRKRGCGVPRRRHLLFAFLEDFRRLPHDLGVVFRRQSVEFLDVRGGLLAFFELFDFCRVVVDFRPVFVRKNFYSSAPAFAARARVCAELFPRGFQAFYFPGNFRRALFVGVGGKPPLLHGFDFGVYRAAVFGRLLYVLFVGFLRLALEVGIRSGQRRDRRYRHADCSSYRVCLQRKVERVACALDAQKRAARELQQRNHARQSADFRKRHRDRKRGERARKQRRHTRVFRKNFAHSFEQPRDVGCHGREHAARSFRQVAPSVGALFEPPRSRFRLRLCLRESRRGKLLDFGKLFLLRLALGKSGYVFLQRARLALHGGGRGFDCRHHVHVKRACKPDCRTNHALHLVGRNTHRRRHSLHCKHLLVAVGCDALDFRRELPHYRQHFRNVAAVGPHRRTQLLHSHFLPTECLDTLEQRRRQLCGKPRPHRAELKKEPFENLALSIYFLPNVFDTITYFLQSIDGFIGAFLQFFKGSILGFDCIGKRHSRCDEGFG